MRVFLMPDIEALCRALNLDASKGGDALPSDVFATPASYRAALHRALIQRSPGRYARAWQAARLGVCEESCRRYERAAQIPVTPVYRERPLQWSTLETTLPAYPLPGCFIQDETGKRYPPLVQLARKLMAAGRQLVYKSQGANFYGELPPPQVITMLPVGAELPALEPLSLAPPQPVPSQPLPSQPAPPYKAILPAATPDPDPGRVALILRPMPYPPAVPLRAAAHDAHTQMSEQIYAALRALKPEGSLTRRNAQKLAAQYDAALIQRGLNVLAGRRNIRNPAGFLQTWLRSESRRTQTTSLRF